MVSTREPKTQLLSVRAAERTFSVLEAFSRHGRSKSLASIAKETGLDKSAVQRCAATLTGLGYLAPTVDHKLRATSKCLDLGFNFLATHPLLPYAYPILLNLREETGERTNLSLFERTYLVYAIRLHGKGGWDLPMSLIGRRMPVYSTAGGRAMLSKLPDDEVRQILSETNLRPRTSQTRTSLTEIIEQVRIARRSGYSVVKGEAVAREIALAAAVTGGDGQPIAAVHVSGSLADWTIADFSRRFAPLVVNAAQALSNTSCAATMSPRQDNARRAAP
jgi:DNA-binding IclR family transcriptional regulator